LNRTINDAVERRQPVSVAGHRLKFFYATQVRRSPPTFLLFVNRDEIVLRAIQKTAHQGITPGIWLRRLPDRARSPGKPKTIESKRHRKALPVPRRR